MEPVMKVCPMCLKDIPGGALSCPYCRTQFQVKVTGYCTTCHELVAADADGKCSRCGNPVLDARVETPAAARSAPPVEAPAAPPSDAEYRRPGSYIDRRLRPGERILFRTRLHPALLGSAFFSLLIGAGIFLSFWWVADQSYPEELAIYATRPISPGDTVLEVNPMGIYVMYGIAALVALGGLRRLVTYAASEMAITSERLLGHFAAFISKSVDIPLASIASTWGGRSLLGNYGNVILSYLPRRTLVIPYIPHPKEFSGRLREAMPAQPAMLQRVSVGRVVLGVLVALVGFAAVIFALVYLNGGKQALQPVARADFDTIGQFEKSSRVTIEGYLVLPDRTKCDTDCALYLVNYDDPEQRLIIFVDRVAEGETPEVGKMKYLPAKFEKTDLALRLEDGSYATHGADVLLTGKVWDTTDGEQCLMVTGAAQGSLPDPTPTPPAAAVDFDTVCRDIGRNVQIKGQITRLPIAIYCSFGNCPLDLHPVGKTNPDLTILVPFGDGNNRMERLPSSYKNEDLKIHTGDGQVAGVGDVIILSGTVEEYENDLDNVLDCQLQVREIEMGEPLPTALPPTSTPAPVSVAFDQICQNDGNLVILQGQLSPLSNMIFCYGTCPLYVQEVNGQGWVVVVRIGFDGGPNEMERLPDDYTNNDLKVHTADGQVLGVGSPIRVLGRVKASPNTAEKILDCTVDVITITAP